MSKFNLRIETDESGNPVRKWVPDDQDTQPPVACALYGDYVMTDAAHIEEAKADLLEGMFGKIRELAKKDNFWIVKNHGEGQFSVAWKAEFPQMMEGNR